MRSILTIPARIFLLVACLTGFTGCGGRPAGNLDPAIAGEYKLLSVNRRPVPVSVRKEGEVVQVLSGSLHLRTDGTCRSRLVLAPGAGLQVNREVRATCSFDGSRLTLQWEEGGSAGGSIRGDTITLNNEGLILYYRKQKI